jgi:hypothetical protein
MAKFQVDSLQRGDVETSLVGRSSTILIFLLIQGEIRHFWLDVVDGTPYLVKKCLHIFLWDVICSCTPQSSISTRLLSIQDLLGHSVPCLLPPTNACCSYKGMPECIFNLVDILCIPTPHYGSGLCWL